MIDPNLIAAGAKVLGAVLTTPPAGPAQAFGSGGANTLNADGWTVSFGSSRANAAPINKTTTSGEQASPFTTATSKAGMPPWLGVAMVIVFGGLLWKKLGA